MATARSLAETRMPELKNSLHLLFWFLLSEMFTVSSRTLYEHFKIEKTKKRFQILKKRELFIKLHYFVIKKSTRKCNTSLWKAWGAKHIFRMTTIFHIENFFHCIKILKIHFPKFSNITLKKKYVPIIFEHRTRQNIFFSKKILGCKLRMEWPIYMDFGFCLKSHSATFRKI